MVLQSTKNFIAFLFPKSGEQKMEPRDIGRLRTCGMEHSCLLSALALAYNSHVIFFCQTWALLKLCWCG